MDDGTSALLITDQGCHAIFTGHMTPATDRLLLTCLDLRTWEVSCKPLPSSDIFSSLVSTLAYSGVGGLVSFRGKW